MIVHCSCQHFATRSTFFLLQPRKLSGELKLGSPRISVLSSGVTNSKLTYYVHTFLAPFKTPAQSTTCFQRKMKMFTLCSVQCLNKERLLEKGRFWGKRWKTLNSQVLSGQKLITPCAGLEEHGELSGGRFHRHVRRQSHKWFTYVLPSRLKLSQVHIRRDFIPTTCKVSNAVINLFQCSKCHDQRRQEKMDLGTLHMTASEILSEEHALRDHNSWSTHTHDRQDPLPRLVNFTCENVHIPFLLAAGPASLLLSKETQACDRGRALTMHTHTTQRRVSWQAQVNI